MRIGKVTKARSLARGFTYLGLLALLAIQGAALAALGRHVATAVQRDKEAELRFRGQQIRLAIERYVQAQQPPQFPSRLQDLLVDERLDPPRHHLRQLFKDPFTGQADWEELREPATGSLIGVHSRSGAPRLAQQDDSVAQGERPRVSDWQFVAQPAAAQAPKDGTTTAPTTSGGSS